MISLADREEIENKQEQRIREMVSILKRKDQLPSKFQNAIVKTNGEDPEVVLKKAGYRNIHRGWIYKVEGGRYHAYTDDSKIYLHRDFNTGNGRHRSTVENLKEEQKRIRGFREEAVIPKRNYEVYADLKSIVYPNNPIVKRASILQRIKNKICKIFSKNLI